MPQRWLDTDPYVLISAKRTSLSPVVSVQRYYYASASGEPIGPLEASEIQALAKSGIVTPVTAVIAEGQASWSTVGALGLLPGKQRRSLWWKISLGCVGLIIGYMLIAMVAVFTLQALGSKNSIPVNSPLLPESATSEPATASAPEEFTFVGSCVNDTFGGRAKMMLVARKAPEGFVGHLTLTGDLEGSGTVSGRIEGTTISFVSRSEDGWEIAWQGEIRDGKMSGRYIAPVPEAFRNQVGVEAQQGRWELK